MPETAFATPRRILVTGAGGFVGRHMLATLARDLPQAEVIGTAHVPTPGLEPLDVTDAGAADALVERIAPDACIHLAAIATIAGGRSDPEGAWRVNVSGTLALARALRAHVPHCTLLFASSAEVYGASFRDGAALDETALPSPMNTYAATKASADLALGAMAADGLRVVRLRAFNQTGPGQTPDYVVAAFARQIARIEAGRQEPLMRVGALAPQRDFLDVRDVCAAYVACLRLADRLPAGAILNLASGTPRRIGDILDSLLALSRVTPQVETSQALLRPNDIAVAHGDASRAYMLLGWRPGFDWTTTLRDVLDDWRGRLASEA
ncbi:MAG: NAD-dependent epimerase/dehydratase family protein [Acetobacteraceae bacterium]